MLAWSEVADSGVPLTSTRPDSAARVVALPAESKRRVAASTMTASPATVKPEPVLSASGPSMIDLNSISVAVPVAPPASRRPFTRTCEPSGTWLLIESSVPRVWLGPSSSTRVAPATFHSTPFTWMLPYA